MPVFSDPNPQSVMEALEASAQQGRRIGNKILVELPDGIDLELVGFRGITGTSWSNRAYDAILRDAEANIVGTVRVEYDSADPIWGDHQLRVRRPEDNPLGGYDYAHTPSSRTPEWVPTLLGSLVISEAE